MDSMSEKSPAARMAEDWDRRARENALHYIASGRESWTEDEFFASGRETFEHYLANDLGNICQGRDPQAMRVLEIGCGVGRVTRAFADFFGEVWAVDVSREMIERARGYLSGWPNVHLVQTDGGSLAAVEVEDGSLDFAYSHLVFQHIPTLEAIRGYVRDVARLLRPGGLFKFQVQGAPLEGAQSDTWLGVSISLATARELAESAGFELRHHHGEGTQDFWLWCFKRPGPEATAG